MKNLKPLFLLILISLISTLSAAAQTDAAAGIISEGSQSKVVKPFIFVARDAENYSLLKNMVGDLPPVQTIDFKNYAVVAAFAGEKNTGGYTVNFKPTRKGIFISLRSPSKGDFVTQMLTQPYKVALISAEEERPVQFDFSADWKKYARNYGVVDSRFGYSGGIVGIKKNFNAAGTVSVWTYGNYTTVYFNLRGTRRNSALRLEDFASGNLIGNKISLSKLDAGSFVQTPRPPFEVSGTLNERRLSLKFNSLETRYLDGFTGEGNLRAFKVR